MTLIVLWVEWHGICNHHIMSSLSCLLPHGIFGIKGAIRFLDEAKQSALHDI